jgi:hypothetical protein
VDSVETQPSSGSQFRHLKGVTQKAGRYTETKNQGGHNRESTSRLLVKDWQHKEEKEIKPINEVETIEGYDVAFLGFPIHQMGPDKNEVKLLQKHCVDNRKIVLFITHAAPEDSPDLPPMIEKFRQAARGANIIDTFDCQGELAKGVKLIMSVMPDAKLRRWAKQDNSKGQPDDARIANARQFSKNVMKKLHEMHDPVRETVMA